MACSMVNAKSVVLLSAILLVLGARSSECKENDGITVLGNLDVGQMRSDKVRPRMLKSLVCDRNIQHKTAWLEGITKAHTFSSVKIICPSGNAQYDFDCLQAFCGADSGDIENLTLSEGFNENPSEKTEARDTVRKSQGDVLLFYKIPVYTAFRYDSLFTKAELTDSFNIGVIQNKTPEKLSPEAVAKLVELYTVTWPRFYATHSNPTKADILEFAKTI